MKINQNDFYQSVLNFLESNDGRTFLSGVAASVYLDYYENRSNLPQTEPFYLELDSIIEDFIEKSEVEGFENGAFVQRLIDFAQKDWAENLGDQQQRSLLNFLRREDFYAKELLQEINTIGPIQYNLFPELDRGFIRVLLSELSKLVLEVLHDTMEEMQKNQILENLVGREDKVYH